jgi:hypothetical protein
MAMNDADRLVQCDDGSKLFYDHIQVLLWQDSDQ